MADVEIHEHEHHEEESNGTDDLNRAVGKLEAEADHAGDKLEEHEERLGNVEDDREWLTQTVGSLRNEIMDLTRGLSETMNTLGERLSKLEEHPASSAESFTEPPKKEKSEQQKRHSILDRLI